MMNENEQIARIQKVVSYVWDNPNGTFYRDHFAAHGITTKPNINSLGDLSTLPMLSRNDLAEKADPLSRLYLNKAECDALVTTSGTSGRGVLLSWTKFIEQPQRLSAYKTFGARTLMSFNAYHKFMLYSVRSRESGIRALAGDAHNLARSASLAKLGNVDTLYIPPTLALLFADQLDAEGLTSMITVLVLWGEYCSPITENLIRSRYPAAKLIFEYTLAEIGGCLAQSTELCTDGPGTKHIDTERYHVEVVDDELIVTTLTVPSTFPFIRYRTGDKASVIPSSCACGSNETSITILGRVSGDFIRVGGAEIRASELERVIQEYLPYIEPTFQLHIRELIFEGVKKVSLELSISIKKDIDIDLNALRDRIAYTLTKNFKLSQNMTLEQAISEGLFMPLKVTNTTGPQATTKHVRLVDYTS